MSVSRFHSPEISCQGCAAAIQRAVGNVPGVQKIEVDVPTKVVTVTHDTAPERVTDALKKAGFSAHPLSD